MRYILYKTVNLVNGKIYIGIHQTMNVEDRVSRVGEVT